MLHLLVTEPPAGAAVKAIQHPGFTYEGDKLNSFPNKWAVVGNNGYGFYGHAPRWTKPFSRVACLSVFTESEANRLVAELKMSWGD